MPGLDQKQNLAQTRLTLYGLFAQALNYPDHELIQRLSSGEFVDSLCTSLDTLGQALQERDVTRLKSAYSDKSREEGKLLLELEKEYTRIFFASRPRLAYLFESVYNEGKLYQDSTFEIARLYHDAGLKLGDDFRLPPDHIAVEFEFLSFLCYKEMEGACSGDEEAREYARELQDEVIGKHLGPFAINVAERLEKNAGTLFYRSIAFAILRHFGGTQGPDINNTLHR